MSSAGLEILLMWAAVTAYAAGAALFVVGFVFGLLPARRTALWVSLAGLAPHAVAMGVRWVRTGHGPYLGFYEVVSSYALISIAVVGLLALRDRRFELAGVVATPLAFLLLGAAMLIAPRTDLPITARLASWWLTIHVTFAKLAYGAFMASFALAVLYILRERSVAGSWGELLEKLPRSEVIDDLAYRFMAVGVIFLGIMIAAGAVWANEAWGRYWGWDPIETWSLISWLVYAAVLHLRLTMGWRGRRFAWAAIIALPVVVFALIGVPIVYNSIHGAYLTGVDLKAGR